MNNKIEIVITDDRMRQSIASDIFSSISLLLVVAIGYFLGIPVLQWVAGGAWVLFIIVSGFGQRQKPLTITEARQVLDSMERHSNDSNDKLD